MLAHIKNSMARKKGLIAGVALMNTKQPLTVRNNIISSEGLTQFPVAQRALTGNTPTRKNIVCRKLYSFVLSLPSEAVD